MKVVVLCGGRGLRLRGEVEVPKPLVEIGGRPILWHVMRCFAHFGFKDFVLCLGYRGDAIKEHFVRGEPWRHGDFVLQANADGSVSVTPLSMQEWRIHFVDTGLETATGGRVKRVAHLLSEEPEFFVTYADTLSDLDLRKLLEFHRSHGKLATLTAVRPKFPFGLLTLSPDGEVKRFAEKPRMRKWINGGFFVFRREVLDLLTVDSSLESDLLPQLAKRGELMAFRHEGFWACMDTYKDVLELNRLWDEGKAGWKVWEE